MGFGDSGRGQHSWTVDEEHSREIIRHGLELGVNFYDTAIAYQSGSSEQYLGRAIRCFGSNITAVMIIYHIKDEDLSMTVLRNQVLF